MAKLNRETTLRYMRAQNEARKAARKLTAADDADEAVDGREAFGSELDELGVGTSDGDETASTAAEPDAAGAVSPGSRGAS
jgi:hypothetical protein